MNRYLAAVAIEAAALWAGPWLVYLAVLGGVGLLPVAPVEFAPPAQTSAVERYFGEAVLTASRASPHKYLLRLVAKPQQAGDGLELAWLVARTHNAQFLMDRRMAWWHLCGAALTIWISRNRTRAELIGRAYEIIAAASAPAPPSSVAPAAGKPSQRASSREAVGQNSGACVEQVLAGRDCGLADLCRCAFSPIEG